MTIPVFYRDGKLTFMSTRLTAGVLTAPDGAKVVGDCYQVDGEYGDFVRMTPIAAVDAAVSGLYGLAWQPSSS